MAQQEALARYVLAKSVFRARGAAVRVRMHLYCLEGGLTATERRQEESAFGVAHSERPQRNSHCDLKYARLHGEIVVGVKK